MKNVFIGTYPPRKCGIGTFTQNLYKSIKHAIELDRHDDESYVMAINDFDQDYSYPPEVKRTIRQDALEDYFSAAKYINLSGADCCILEHEYGIFGGPDGEYILSLLQYLEIPLIVTLHTVVKTPSYNQKAVMTEICRRAKRVVVMSNKAVEFLQDIYNVPITKIKLIEHGVPDYKFSQKETKEEFKIGNRKLLFTFGLLSPNKGIETVIKALPKVVQKYPDILYLVLGKTHPNVLRHLGDEYRNYLFQLIKYFKLEKNVILIDEFVNQEDLFKYLYASDIYVTPYLNEAQITSGTLSYAVGVGTAAVSTPYWHATELLADGRGVLFSFNDSYELSFVLSELLDNPEMRLNMRKRAYEYGRGITWPKIGVKYKNLLKRVLYGEYKIERARVYTNR